MSKIYVTGAGGFLGKKLISGLIGDDVISIAHKDIQSREIFDFDVMYFLSSYGNMWNQTVPEAIWKANVQDLLAVLSKIERKQFKSFVYVSSSSVELKHQTMYSRAKRAAEEACLSYMEAFGLPIAVVRPFSVTGIGEQDKHLIPVLISSAYTGTTVPFVPAPTHDFIDVSDVVSLIYILSEKRARGIWEAGTGRSYTNRQVLDLVELITGKKIKTEIKETLREHDQLGWVSKNWKASEIYGWRPQKTLSDSIKEMVEYRNASPL